MRFWVLGGICAGLVLFWGCGGSTGSGPGGMDPTYTSSTGQKFRLEQVASNLDTVWDVQPMPDGRIFITERAGRLRVLDNGVLSPGSYGSFPDIATGGQKGLFDVLPHPNYASNKYLYVTYSASKNSKFITRVARFTDTGTGLSNYTVVYDADTDGHDKHYGGRMAFGPDGKLCLTLGERGEMTPAQDLTKVEGKFLRLNDDGTAPNDNPFVGTAGAKPEIFSLGHRNPQSLAFHPITGMIYSAEHGPSGNDAPGGGDEINMVEAGKNYGWPVIHHDQTQAGMESPMIQFTPATAPGNCAFYSGTRYPTWQNDLFVCNLAGQSLQRFRVNGASIVSSETMLQGVIGRLRGIGVDADGYMYIATSERGGGDFVYRLVPVP